MDRRVGKIGSSGLVFLLVVAALVLSGCVTAEPDLAVGERFAASENWDESVRFFTGQLAENPENSRVKLLLKRSRWRAAMAHLKEGEKLFSARRFDDAIAAFKKSATYQDDSRKAEALIARAKDGKASDHYLSQGITQLKAHRYYQARDALKRAVALDPSNDKAKRALESYRKSGERPKFYGLKLRSKIPVSLKFKKTPVVNVFEILSKLSGINFIFDKDMKESKVTLFMTDVSFDQFMDVLLRTNGLSAKVVNEKTLLVYPDTPAKAKEYQDLELRTFYLANLDAKKAAALLAKVLKIKNITANDELNTVVVRGGRDLIEIASKVIEANDRPPAEVLLNVEILEVKRGKEEQLGLETSESITLGIGETSTAISDDDNFSGFGSLYSLDRLTTKEMFLSLPTATLNILKKDGDTRTLAQPQIRVSHREKASIHIGERVPVRSNRKVDSNNNVTFDFEYIDVGVKLQAEPVINFNDEVELKLHLEISALGENVGTATDPQFAIRTRTTKSVLTVRGGEAIVIGGLIDDTERKDIRKVPILGEMPVLGTLFQSRDTDSSKTDLLMTITPLIIRGQEIPDQATTRMWTGSEKSMSAREPFESRLERKQRYREFPDEEFLMELEKEEMLPETIEKKAAPTKTPQKGGARPKKTIEKKARSSKGVSPGIGAGKSPLKGAFSGDNGSAKRREGATPGSGNVWPETVSHSIQVGSYAGLGEAEHRVASLSRMGYGCYLVEAAVPGIGRRYRVFVGKFDGFSGATDALAAYRGRKEFADDIFVANRGQAFGVR